MAWQRFRQPQAAPSISHVVILLILVLVVVLAPITARYGVNEQVIKIERRQPNQFLLAAHDRVVRHRRHRPRPVQPVLYGGRVSLFIGLAVGDHRRASSAPPSAPSPASGAAGSTTS